MVTECPSVAEKRVIWVTEGQKRAAQLLWDVNNAAGLPTSDEMKRLAQAEVRKNTDG